MTIAVPGVFRRRAGLILLYHRIAEPTSDPQLLAVTPRHFAQHLEVLRNCGTPMSLPQMMSARRDSRLPHRAVAVTFDDGYTDTVDCGEPLLARHDVPATVFVTTSYVGGEREFWWDDLERLLLLPGSLPETLRLRIGQTVHEWRLAESAVYDDDMWRQHRGWTVESWDDPSPRHFAYRALCGLLRTLPGDERCAAIDELTRIAGATSTGRSTHRQVSSERLARASEGRLVEVGAHAATHAALAGLSEAAQRSEIAGSKARLREITGRDPAGFAYPFGGRADYTATTVALVRDAGFAFACSNMPGPVRRGSDPFQLPRLLVRNWDGDAFAARLRGWFGDE